MKKSTRAFLIGKGKVSYHAFLLVLIFHLIVTSSVAWLVHNRRVAANEMGMALAVDDTSAVYEAYMYDVNTGKGINRFSDGTEVNVTNLDLNQYDTLFRAKNQYTPAFAKICITRNESMPKNGALHLTIERLPDDKLKEGKNYTSRIARFTALIISSQEDLSIADADTLYHYINNLDRYKEITAYEGNGYAHSKTFITPIGQGKTHEEHEKADSITISVKYTEEDWYDDDQGREDALLNVYFYISYDEALIDCYIKENLDDTTISYIETGIQFENDLQKIKVSYSAP